MRGAYSTVQSARQALGGIHNEVRVSQPYEEADFVTSPIAPSGRIESDRTQAAHVQNLRLWAYSDGLQLTTEALADLVSLATTSRLKGVKELRCAYPELEGQPDVRAVEPTLSVPDSNSDQRVQAIAGDPILHDVVRQYLGYQPTRASSWLFWSLRNELSDGRREALNQTVRYHYDVDGFNFVYVNFYLTPTTRMSGAHVLIEGTHRTKSLKQLLSSARIDDDEALRCFGEERIRLIEGPPGSGFFEDASCYHKILPPRDADRLMLQIRFK